MRSRAIATLAASGVACLGLPAAAGAVTISEDATINCSTGQAPAGFNWQSAIKTFVVKDGLTITSGDTLSATHGAANPERCRIQVDKGRVTINGTLDYDQRGNMEKGGPLELISAEQVEIDGEVASDGAAGANGPPLLGGDGTSGGDAGTVLVRGPVVTVDGTVTADGGNGGNGTALPLIGSANGGNGGDAGSATVISDFGAFTLNGSMSARPGVGGTNAGAGTNGDGGADNGVVRRNALSIAGNGQFTAATRRTNAPPTRLATTSQPQAGANAALTWSDNSDEESGFVVSRSTGSGPFEAVGAVGANVRAFTDPSALAAGQTYRYLIVPSFPSEIWPGALVASNLLTVSTAGTAPPAATPNPTQGTTQPAPSGRFSVSRSAPLRSSYSLPAGRRGLRLSIRSLGRGQLRASLRVRTRRGSRTASRTVSVTRGVKSFTLRLPQGWKPGRYSLRLMTIAPNGQTKTVTKRIRLRTRSA